MTFCPIGVKSRLTASNNRFLCKMWEFQILVIVVSLSLCLCKNVGTNFLCLPCCFPCFASCLGCLAFPTVPCRCAAGMLQIAEQQGCGQLFNWSATGRN